MTEITKDELKVGKRYIFQSANLAFPAKKYEAIVLKKYGTYASLMVRGINTGFFDAPMPYRYSICYTDIRGTEHLWEAK